MDYYTLGTAVRKTSMLSLLLMENQDLEQDSEKFTLENCAQAKHNDTFEGLIQPVGSLSSIEKVISS
jgi:hypothetical protein